MYMKYGTFATTGVQNMWGHRLDHYIWTVDSTHYVQPVWGELENYIFF